MVSQRWWSPLSTESVCCYLQRLFRQRRPSSVQIWFFKTCMAFKRHPTWHKNACVEDEWLKTARILWTHLTCSIWSRRTSYTCCVIAWTCQYNITHFCFWVGEYFSGATPTLNANCSRKLLQLILWHTGFLRHSVLCRDGFDTTLINWTVLQASTLTVHKSRDNRICMSFSSSTYFTLYELKRPTNP